MYGIKVPCPLPLSNHITPRTAHCTALADYALLSWSRNYVWGPPRGWGRGNRGTNVFIPGENKQFWGTGNIGNEDFDFGEQGNKAIYFRGIREREGLMHALIISPFMRKEPQLTFYANETTSFTWQTLQKRLRAQLSLSTTKPTHWFVDPAIFLSAWISAKSDQSASVGRKRLTIKCTAKTARPGNSVGCVIRLAGSILESGHIAFVEIWPCNNFYGHFLPAADFK